MRWFDMGPEAHGVIAVGQVATGVIAVGQAAWGLVAIGQFAFGAIAVGQVAVGGVAVGMLGFGTTGAIAMLGAGGRGRGWIVPLLPSLARRRTPAGVVSFDRARQAGGGWVRLHVVPRSGGLVVLFDGQTRLSQVRLDARVRHAGAQAAPGEVWAHLRPTSPAPGPSAEGFVADRLIAVPVDRLWSPRWWLVWGAQLMALLLLAGVVWGAVGEVLLAAWFGPVGLFTAAP